MTDFSNADLFVDRALQDDPYEYFDWVRERSPVWQEPEHGVFLVTGHAEAMEIYTDPATFPDDAAASGTFSSCNVVCGPFVRFSEPPTGSDITESIRKYRDELPFSDQLPSFDPPHHSDHRHLMMRLITPKNLRANEEFMWTFADEIIEPWAGTGAFEMVGQFAEPFTLIVVADLEGVPEEDRQRFREGVSRMAGNLEHRPLEFLYGTFAEYIEDRRKNPRQDILSALATATFPDGSTPTVHDASLLAANLFTGGQETTVRMLSFAMRNLAENPDLQDALRADRETIPNFIEETLRLEAPLRAQFRMPRVDTEVAGVKIPAGASVLMLPGACSRDPRVFEDPHTFDLHRANARQHMAFGFGIHTCAGAPLARAEGRVAINRILDRTADIRVSEEHHGPAGDRRYEYLPTYFLRGLRQLHCTFSPTSA